MIFSITNSIFFYNVAISHYLDLQYSENGCVNIANLNPPVIFCCNCLEVHDSHDAPVIFCSDCVVHHCVEVQDSLDFPVIFYSDCVVVHDRIVVHDCAVVHDFSGP